MTDKQRDSNAIHQIPLNIQLRDDATLSSFYASEENHEAVQSVTRIAHGGGESLLYLWGQADVGKTHLLQAVCHAASEMGIPSFYLPLREEDPFSWNRLQGIEGIPLVCIDDIDTLAGNPLWEEAFFHLFNRMQLQKNRLLASANVPPKQLHILLPDLTSRLASGVVYQLHGLNDEQKINALQLRAMQRGLQLPKAVGSFLLNRCPRNMSKLFDTLEILDRASLAEQRRLTIPFVKYVLDV